MAQLWHAEGKRRYRRVKPGAIVGQHLITTLHAADRRIEHGTAGVPKRLSWPQVRLLADHSIAAHLFFLAITVGDDPMPSQQFRWNLAVVANRNRIREYVALRFRA